jgi:hypothetical protein
LPSDDTATPARPAIYQATARPADAADAFRRAWLLDATDPQNAYRLVVHRSDSTTASEIEQALASFATIEGELIRLERSRARSPFRTTQAIDDEAGGAMAFVPPLYARGFSLLQRGEHEEGLVALRAAVASDPLVTDAASRSGRWRRASRRCGRAWWTPPSNASRLR